MKNSKKKQLRKKSVLLPKANHMESLHIYSIFIEKFNETRQITANTRNILHGIPIPFPV